MTSVLDALRDRARREPGAVAVRAGEREIGCAGLLDLATDVARALAARDLGTVAVALDNSIEWVALDLATRMTGAALVPVPPFFSPQQVRHVLADSGAQAVVVDATGHAQLQGAELADDSDLLPGCRLLRVASPSRPTLAAGVARISYTSGTTGTPKGACLTQDVLDRVAASLHEVTADLRIRTHLCLLPLATLLENVAGIYAPMLAGATIALPGIRETGLVGAAGLDPDRLLACIRSHAAESVILLPQMLAGLLDRIERGAPPPETLRFAAVGGGFVGRTLLERADRVGLPVYEGYGLTECASVVALNTPAARRIGSAGRPLPHVRIRIDADSQILVSGASMSGYLGGAPFDASEVPTGDLGHLDADGFLHIHGRARNVFITSFGRNVAPEWVEAELLGRGTIVQAAVFGEARPWNVAVIVPADARLPDASIEAAVDAANANLPDYARVRRWIRAHEPFTTANGMLTGNGRNRRSEIQARYRRHIDACHDEPAATCA